MNSRSRSTDKDRHNRKREPTWHPRTKLEWFRGYQKALCREASWRWTSLLVLCVFSGQLQAQETEFVSPDQVQSGSLLLQMENGYRVATRLDTAIDAQVNGLVAKVKVRQSFQNDGSDWAEGIYVFPLPDEAAVDHLRLVIGERIIEGEIREKAKARKDYEIAKSEGRKASLVEQQRANMFRTSVANIAPGETVIVEIEYLETVRYDSGQFSLRFPVTLTPRYIPGSPIADRTGSGWAPATNEVPDASDITPPVVRASAAHKLQFTANIDAGVPLDLVASRYHVVDIANTDSVYTVRLGNSDVPMDHDIELTWRPVPASAPRAMVFTEIVDNDPYALLMMLPPDAVSLPATDLPRELILVIDTSGSMHGTSIAQAKRALGLALGELAPTDRFNVIQFNSTMNTLFPASMPASATNIAIARRYVEGLSANGGTEMKPALISALATPRFESWLRQVIFITDGSVGNEEALYRVIEQQLGNARLFTVGIGSAPNSWFMRKAAESGRGTFTMISALHEVNEKMNRLFAKISSPRVTDIEIDWPDGFTPETYPARVPDLYAGEPVVVRLRLPAELPAGTALPVTGKSAVGDWQAMLEWQSGKARSGIAQLWARARIEDLMDRKRRGAPEDDIRPAVIATALRHHLVSAYTSLVAVDKTPARPLNAALKQQQVPNLLPHGQSTQAIFGFASTATPAMLHFLKAILSLAAALLLLALVWRSGDLRGPVCET